MLSCSRHVGHVVVVAIEDFANDEGETILDGDLAHSDTVSATAPFYLSYVLRGVEFGQNTRPVVGGDRREEAGDCPLSPFGSGSAVRPRDLPVSPFRLHWGFREPIGQLPSPNDRGASVNPAVRGRGSPMQPGGLGTVRSPADCDWFRRSFLTSESGITLGHRQRLSVVERDSPDLAC
jgi:hypothetical protein